MRETKGQLVTCERSVWITDAECFLIGPHTGTYFSLYKNGRPPSTLLIVCHNSTFSEEEKRFLPNILMRVFSITLNRFCII